MDTQELHKLIERKLGGKSTGEDELLLDEWFQLPGDQPLFTEKYTEQEISYMLNRQFAAFSAMVENKKSPLFLVVV